MTNHKPDDEQQRPGDEPESVLPLPETPPSEDVFALTDAEEDVIEVTDADVQPEPLEVVPEAEAPLGFVEPVISEPEPVAAVPEAEAPVELVETFATEPDPAEVVDFGAPVAADATTPEASSSGINWGDVADAPTDPGSDVRITAPADTDLLAQLSAEEQADEVVDLSASEDVLDQDDALEDDEVVDVTEDEEEVVDVTEEASETDVFQVAPESPLAAPVESVADFPVADDSSTVDLGGLEAHAPITPPSGVDSVDFAAVGDEPLAVEGASGVWKSDDLPLPPVESTVDLATLQPPESGSGAGLPGTSAVGLTFPSADQPLAEETATAAWDIEPTAAAQMGDQGSVIDLGVPEPFAPSGAVSDLRLMPEAMEPGLSSVRLEGQTDAEAASPGQFAPDMTEAELDLGAVERSPDIAEQIESSLDLPGADVEDVVDLDAPSDEAMPPALEEEDDAVDLGASVRSEFEDEPAASASGAMDLGEPMPEGAEDVDPDMQALADEFSAAGQEGDVEFPEPVDEDADAAPAPKKAAKPEKKRGGIGGVLVGTVLGLLIGAGGFYGSMAGGIVDPAMLGLASAPPPWPTVPTPPPPPPVDPHVALNTGDLEKAIEAFGQADADDPKVMASHGQALWLRSLQTLAKNDVDPAKFGEELAKDENFAKAKEMLVKAADAKNADAVFWLAEIEEWTDGPAKAKERIEAGLQEFANDPSQKARFEAALNRLNLHQAAAPPAEGEARRGTMPWIVLALVALQNPEIPPDPKPVADVEEAGDDFWKAVGLARKGDFALAIEALNKAQKTHARNRLLRPKQQQNPRSDPMERIFLTACDEIRTRWQLEAASAVAIKALEDGGYTTLADELKMQKDPAKVLTALAAAVQGVAAEIEKAKLEKFDKPEALKLADLPGAIKTAGLGGVAEKEKVDAIVAVLKDAKVDKFKDAEEGMAFTKDELVKGVKDVLAQTAAEKARVEAVVAALKDAKADKFKDAEEGMAFTKEDLAAGIKELGDEKVKVEAVTTALKDAKVDKFATPAEGVKTLAGERDTAQTELASANTTLDSVLKPLVDNKHLPAGAKRSDTPKGVANLLATADHPAVKGLAEAVRELSGLGGKVGNEVLKEIDVRAQLVGMSADNLRLRGQLAERWSPEEMLLIWRDALVNGGGGATIDMALKDAGRVTDPKARDGATCVLALAARNQGKFDQARGLLKGLDLPETSPWRGTAERLRAQLSDPGAYFLPEIRRAREAGNLDQALAMTDAALVVFPKDSFLKESATLTALRGLLRLEKAISVGKASADDIKAATDDATAAKDAGESIEGNYVLGRIAEATGDLAKAEKFYEEALNAFRTANPKSDANLEAFQKDHPTCDPIGNRYRVALSRVILAQRAGGRKPAPFAPPAPKEEKPAASLPTQPKIILVADARKEAGVALADDPPAAPAVVANAGPVVVKPALIWVGGCPSVLALPTILVDPGVAVGAEDDLGAPPDPRLDEAIRLAREAADLARTSRDPRAFEAYLVLGEALARKGKWTDGLFGFVEGMKVLCPEYGPRLAVLVADHPAFKRPDAIRPPDPLRAEGFFGRGLRLYFERRYDEAEKEFFEAVRFSDQDARYLYFLGLTRLAQGKRDLALEDFRLGARLEALEKPARAAVSFSLERVQGPHRRLLNQFRDRAEREAVGVGP